MKCYICLWDLTNDPDSAIEKLMDRNYPRDAITSHNGTALCAEHIDRIWPRDVIFPSKAARA